MRARFILRTVLLTLPLLVMQPAGAQDDDFQQRLVEAGNALALADPRVQKLGTADRQKLASFVLGNAIFTLSHELAHALISEFKLPVLGREEDAADTFATLAMLFVGTDLSHRVLVNTARALRLMADREKSAGQQPQYYSEHGLDLQRAYNIICLMVGSNPTAFRQVAVRADMPVDRQQTCQIDFDLAAASWVSLLESHMLPAAKPRQSFLNRLLRWRRPQAAQRAQNVNVDYQHAPDALAGYKSALQAGAVLELVGSFADENFAFPMPITVKAASCGAPTASWDIDNRQLIFCYELLTEYVDLALSDPDL